MINMKKQVWFQEFAWDSSWLWKIKQSDQRIFGVKSTAAVVIWYVFHSRLSIEPISLVNLGSENEIEFDELDRPRSRIWIVLACKVQ